MVESVRGHRRRIRTEARRASREAFEFTRWFVRGKFAMMRSFLPDLEERDRDEEQLRSDYLRTVGHAQRVQGAQTVVTALLALGVVATLAATVSRLAFVPASVATGTTRFLDLAAAWTASFSVVLLVARLLFDRYLSLVETCATFLGMQIASAPR